MTDECEKVTKVMPGYPIEWHMLCIAKNNIKVDKETLNMTEDEGWVLKIKRIENGYLLSGVNDNGVIVSWAVTDDVDESENVSGLDPDARAGYNLLWEVMDYYCFTGSKHDDARIRIEIVKKE